MNLRFLILPLTLSAAACQYPEVSDHGNVCVRAEQDGDQHTLVVEANSGDCASDHEGASFECSLSLDGTTVHIETVFQDGKDPNDACNGPLETTCTIELEPGTYTLEFDGAEETIEVPSDHSPCLPHGSAETTG